MESLAARHKVAQNSSFQTYYKLHSPFGLYLKDYTTYSPLELYLKYSFCNNNGG